MAGKEVSGAETPTVISSAAQHGSSLKRMIRTPCIGHRERLPTEWRAWPEKFGCRVLDLDPDRHDVLCAWVSHLPQYLSTALSALLEDEFPAKDEMLPIGGRALREMTRLGASPFSMWRDVAHTNTEAVAASLLALEQRLAHLRENLRTPELRDEFERANRFRASMDIGEKVAGPKNCGLVWSTCVVAAILLALVFCAPAMHTADNASPTLLVDMDHRPSMSLNGTGTISSIPTTPAGDRIPPTATCPARAAMPRPALHCRRPVRRIRFAKSPTIKVPGDWNTQKPELFYYEGLLWYEREFDFHPKAAHAVFLHIGAANYAAHVFVNDVHVCDHEGGFTPFDCDITSAVKDGSNSTVIAVENVRALDRVPTIKSDWWNYGGLTREVSIVEVPETFIDDESVHLTKTGDIEGDVHLTGATAGMKATVRIPALHVDQTAAVGDDGRAKFSVRPEGLERWSPENPRLYKVEFTAGDDHLTDDVGFRTIEVQGDEILLNGKSIFLRGVNIHAEAPYRSGRAWSEQDAEHAAELGKGAALQFYPAGALSAR